MLMTIRYLILYFLLNTFLFSQNYELFSPQALPNESSSSDPFDQPLPELKSDNSSPPSTSTDINAIYCVFDEKDILSTHTYKDGIHKNLNDSMKFNETEYKKVLEPFLKKKITNQLLTELTRELVLFMRSENHPVVDVIVPEQDITNGVLQILIKVSKIGEILIKGNKWFSNEIISNSFHSQKGVLIDGKLIKEDLNWINRNPFRQVDFIFSEGINEWETDLTMEVNDKLPFRSYAGYENNGNELTGFDRYFIGVNWGNAWKKDHQLNYQFTTNKVLGLSKI